MLVALALLSQLALAVPLQITFKQDKRSDLSKWSRSVKQEFLKAASDDSAHDWTIVQGNQAGDSDSMVSALAWAWHLSHSPEPQKAVAMLQSQYDVVNLRKENLLALEHSEMEAAHADLLSVDELPVKPWDLWHRIKGVALVDHNVLVSDYTNTSVLSIFDHHQDRNESLHADPRIISMTGSCSSLVTLEIARQRKAADKSNKKRISPFPVELADILLHTIALDTSGAKKKKMTPEDTAAVEWLWPLSPYKDDDVKHRMKKLADHMEAARADLSGQSVRDLLRRDYKGGPVPTKSKRFPEVVVGYANVPVSMDAMIRKTPEGTSSEWFAIARTWTAETGQDVSIIQTKYKDADGNKHREIALLVARGWAGRLDMPSADSLFNFIKNELEKSDKFNIKPWIRPDGKPLLPRRAVWHYIDGEGRKFVRPFIEDAVRKWSDPTGSE